jgi:DNA-binding CsgD family transcriptional regulator
MRRIKPGHALAAIVAAVAVLNTLSAISMPVPHRKPAAFLMVSWLVLLALHAALYRFGEQIRERYGLRVYTAIQAALVFSVAVSRAPTPVTIALFMALTAELVVLAGAAWGSIPITIGAIVLYVVAALISSGLYSAATAGLFLAITGLVAHAVAGLFRRPVAVESTTRAAPETRDDVASGLSAREVEVLRELVRGARNSEIARTLGISERTVKSHLGSIYQKLGVASRAGAVAMAVQRKLV